MNASTGPIEPDAPLVSEGGKRRATKGIAIYAKGGIGKSLTLANLP